jgi:hypothetical protein
MWKKITHHVTRYGSGNVHYDYKDSECPNDSRRVFVMIRFEGLGTPRNELHISRWSHKFWLHPYTLPTESVVTHWCELSALQLPEDVSSDA